MHEVPLGHWLVVPALDEYLVNLSSNDTSAQQYVSFKKLFAPYLAYRLRKAFKVLKHDEVNVLPGHSVLLFAIILAGGMVFLPGT